MSPDPRTSTQHVTGTVDPCACGVCGTDVPPLVGSILTGTGLTLDAAADLLLDGVEPANLTDVQRRLVEHHAETRLAAR